jgi:hypothetical protein
MHKFTTPLNVIFGLLMLVFICNSQADPLKTRTSAKGILFVTGGIGEEQKAELKTLAKNFSLQLLFSEGVSGRAVTDLNVDIYSESDEQVFRIVRAKPILLVNLPAGTYTILANNAGQRLRHKFTLEEGVPQKIILNWKDSLIEEDMPLDGQGN